MSRLMRTADAVARTIDEMDLDLPRSPERTLEPLYEIEALDETRVVVVPVSETREKVTRHESTRDLVVHIGVLRKLDADFQGDAYDPYGQAEHLMTLVERIADGFEDRHLPLGEPADGQQPQVATWMGTRVVPYLPEHVRDHRSFTGVIELTYRVLG